MSAAVLGSWCATWFWNIAFQRLPSPVIGPIGGMEAKFEAFFYLLWEQRMPAPSRSSTRRGEVPKPRR
ncbi:hypothetical protein [Streptomyces botrytidirepellens]|uniref:hypothetical protein n=1 Tax=Streptomyces botrytidirepellens TaxID=2486417 RepID=UPI001FECEFA5|nr:hypothetical protein [Streptomyces botrytidirepellens]